MTLTIGKTFLQKLKNDALPVSVFLANGVQLQGTIDNFDDHVLILTNNYPQLVYLHAISSIMPKKF